MTGDSGDSTKQILGIISDALVNAMVSELEVRAASFGGIRPVPRKQAEEQALTFLMMHVALTAREQRDLVTGLGAVGHAQRFASLWQHQRSRVLALIPILNGDEKELQ